MIGTYHSKVATRRWPMVVWTTMLNVAELNGFIIWRETHPDWEQRRRNAIRSEYLKQLGFQLIQPQVQKRSDVPGLTSCITLAVSTVGKTDSMQSQQLKNSDNTYEPRPLLCLCLVSGGKMLWIQEGKVQ